jgi:hypothetical protein
MGVVNTTYTFTSTDTITSAKMNNIIDETTFTGDAIQGTTLQVVSPGKLAVSAGGITSNELASNSVVTAKIADSNVTTAKIADSNVTTAKIADSSVTPVKLSQPLTSAIAQNTTSGTSIDFTGIPSWVKRITVMLNGISGNGSSNPMIQLGDSGGIENSGYAGSIGFSGATSNAAAFSSGFLFNLGVGAVTATSGVATLLNISGNVWIYAISAGYADQAYSLSGGGTKTLSETLDRLRITTVDGTDTFDAGSVNIMYE